MHWPILSDSVEFQDELIKSKRFLHYLPKLSNFPHYWSFLRGDPPMFFLLL